MANKSGKAYGLTTLCPIVNGELDKQSFSALTRDRLEKLPIHDKSPMARVPNTYLCRFFVLNDVFFEGKPANNEHLRSKYLVFASNFYGDLDTYLRGMWQAAQQEVKDIWKFCVGFSKVNDADSFIDYIKKCQVKTTLYFNGSTDDPLREQLKSLYLKQEVSKFVHENQGKKPEDLQAAFDKFIERVQPNNLDGPTWKSGASTLESAVTHNEV